MTPIEPATVSDERDDIRIAAVYDEHGRATSVDVVMNVDSVSADDINDIVRTLRALPQIPQPVSMKPSITPPDLTKGSFIATAG
ncbi:MAG: hypothetical protein M3N52_11955 [Actinomycetota bacterium]|nr:hypothetical protein [Actinomycetota bacterium]